MPYIGLFAPGVLRKYKRLDKAPISIARPTILPPSAYRQMETLNATRRQKIPHDQRSGRSRTAVRKRAEKKRVDGSGPVFVKLGKAVRYEITALDDWIAAGRRKSTAGPLNAAAHP